MKEFRKGYLFVGCFIAAIFILLPFSPKGNIETDLLWSAGKVSAASIATALFVGWVFALIGFVSIFVYRAKNKKDDPDAEAKNIIVNLVVLFSIPAFYLIKFFWEN